MALRRLLEAANSDTGFTNQEKGMCVNVFMSLDSGLHLAWTVFVCDQTEECCHTGLVLSVRSWRVPQQAFPAPPSRATPQDQVTAPPLFFFFVLFCLHVQQCDTLFLVRLWFTQYLLGSYQHGAMVKMMNLQQIITWICSLAAALHRFIVSFRLMFSCLVHNFIVLVQCHHS